MFKRIVKIWKTKLFKKYYWQAEDIDRMEKRAKKFMKAFNIKDE